MEQRMPRSSVPSFPCSFWLQSQQQVAADEGHCSFIIGCCSLILEEDIRPSFAAENRTCFACLTWGKKKKRKKISNISFQLISAAIPACCQSQSPTKRYKGGLPWAQSCLLAPLVFLLAWLICSVNWLKVFKQRNYFVFGTERSPCLKPQI